MAREERARGGIFGISAPTREAPAPVLPRPDVQPAPPVSPEPGKHPKTKKSLIRRLAGNLALRFILAGTVLGGTGYATYETIPAVHRTINQAIGILSAEDVPNTFDNANGKGLIGNNNTIPASLQEIQSKFPQQIVAEGSAIKFLLPFQLPEGTAASYVKSLSDRLPTQEVRKQAETANIKDHIDFVLPKGTIIIAPVDGHGAIGFGIPEFGQDPTKAYGTAIVFYDQDKNRTYLIKIFSLNQVALDPIVNMSRFDDKKYFRDTGWKDLPVIDRFKPLMEVQTDNQQLRISIEAYEGQKIGPAATLIDKTLFLVTPQFFSSSGSSGQEQLVGLQQN